MKRHTAAQFRTLPVTRFAVLTCLPIVFGAVAIAAAPVQAQEGGGAETAPARVYLPDWRLRSPDQIRSGTISVIHEAGAPRLHVHQLAAERPPVLVPVWTSQSPSPTGDHFVIADFHTGAPNLLGGLFNAFARAPSEATVSVAAAPDGRKALGLSYRRQERGFSGVWVHLFDTTIHPARRLYLDARPFATLSLWVRGERGGERVLLKLADAAWETRGEAIPLGELGEFLPTGRVEPEWQQAVVRLDRLPTHLDPSTLASVVLEALGPAEGRVFVSQLALSVGHDPPALRPYREPPVEARTDRQLATWIWNTAEILDQPGKRDSLLSFLSDEGLDVVFLQLVTAPGDTPPPGEIRPDPRLRDLVSRLSRLGISVYALDGYAGYARPEYHAGVLNTIRNVIRFNAESRDDERFFGVRYDIEPYLLPGFHGPARADILAGYLDLLARGVDAAHQGNLVFGVDIPFWFDAPDEVSFESVMVEFRGADKPVSEHVIDLVDDLSIMDYRTVAHGADGTIRHAAGELEYASRAGKPTYVALETGALPDETLIEFGGDPVISSIASMDGPGVVAVVADQDSAYVFWVETDPESSARTGMKLESQLRRAGLEPETAVVWAVSRRVFVPADKLSFAALGKERLRRVMEETTTDLARFGSFAGFAIHHSDSYMRLQDDARGSQR
ncbi:MAG: hypothetical protein OEM96_06880 [Gemmatimonadota bacterium]|nr:hypothetical protein [Gemmatimonadota bacterium]